MGTRWCRWGWWRGWAALVVVPVLVTACGVQGGSDTGADVAPTPAPSSQEPSSAPGSRAPGSGASAPDTMPDLIGLGSADAARRISELGLGSEWDTVAVRCGARPGTVVHQVPAPGSELTDRTVVRLRTAILDLDEFRGPCEADELGPVTGPDAVLARALYRFAADPALGAPFVAGGVWTGIEDGLAARTVGPEQRADLTAWQLDAEYAERGGPFSALDVLAGSGGHYEVRRGIVGTCPGGNPTAPAELAGLRAISLTVPEDSIDSCLQWWGVSVFLDHGRIRGVALRLGSP
ncbi:PASTA domain-containing protein [Nocardioides sp.]|uniref:PASTA domain-containing protein n=1 Tax=Nocardioides sp. TaxID=35761 RepID=UPI00260D88CA|nr:PASTA domain-containing protein [Nocardioides sp.]MDI6909943.1 PASTA domain-containing protein [Nocardioides sp.]